MKWLFYFVIFSSFSCKEKMIFEQVRKNDSLKYSKLVDISGIFVRDEFENKERNDTRIKTNYCIFLSIYEYNNTRFGYYKIYNMDTYNQKYLTGNLYIDYDTTLFANHYRWIKKYTSDTTDTFGCFEIWEFEKESGYQVQPKELKIIQKKNISTKNYLYGEYRKIHCRGDKIPFKVIPENH